MFWAILETYEKLFISNSDLAGPLVFCLTILFSITLRIKFKFFNFLYSLLLQPLFTPFPLRLCIVAMSAHLLFPEQTLSLIL